MNRTWSPGDSAARSSNSWDSAKNSIDSMSLMSPATASCRTRIIWEPARAAKTPVTR